MHHSSVLLLSTLLMTAHLSAMDASDSEALHTNPLYTARSALALTLKKNYFPIEEETALNNLCSKKTLTTAQLAQIEKILYESSKCTYAIYKDIFSAHAHNLRNGVYLSLSKQLGTLHEKTYSCHADTMLPNPLPEELRKYAYRLVKEADLAESTPDKSLFTVKDMSLSTLRSLSTALTESIKLTVDSSDRDRFILTLKLITSYQTLIK